ncbi:MAG: hypothetical protein FJ291_16760, partial [Planctomycetes bacterium]|nr:hypothetical protein [Planctomycetota bacterium]
MRSKSVRASCLLSLLAVSLCCPHGAAAGERQKLKVTYDFRDPHLAAVGDCSRVSVEGCERTRTAGEPAVPFRSARVLLPPGCQVVGVRARTVGAERQLGVAKPVEFGRVAIPLGSDPARVAAARAADKPSRAVYDSDAPYPRRQVELASVQRMNGYAVAFLRLYPVQYVPKRNRLAFSARLEVELEVVGGASLPRAESKAIPLLRRSARDAARVAALVDNSEALGDYPTPTATGGGVVKGAGTFDYLLVTSSTLLPSFQPLVDRKVAAGLVVKTETMENIRAGYTGRDDAERLRNYIIDAYTNWGIRYVLLGGDTGVVPHRGVYGHVSGSAAKGLGDYYDNNIPSDLYYACLDGPWDFDGDGIWAEPNDGANGGDVDMLAEVYVGRAPVDTPAEAQLFASKIVAYETNAHPNVNKALFLAESLGGGAQGGDGLDPLLPHFAGYTIQWLDDRVSSWSGTAHAIPALNASPHLVAHVGHTNWQYAMRLTNTNLASLTNTGLFLANSIGCDPGAFDYSDSFAEQLEKLNASGAFAVVMNSRYGWYNPDAEWMFSGEFQKSLFDRLLTQGNRNVGVANQLAKEALLSKVEHSEGPDGMVYRWCYFEINLLGDPHTPLQTTASGKALTVRSFDASPGANRLFSGLNVSVNPPPAGTTEFSRFYTTGASVTLTAPSTHTTLTFRRWQLDGVDQPLGALSLPVTMNADHTATAVYQDTTPPTLASATAAQTSVDVEFSEPLDAPSAQTPANYSIDKGITIASATLQPDQKTVRLATSAHTSGQTYTLTVSNVKDLPGNTILPASQIQYQFNMPTDLIVDNSDPGFSIVSGSWTLYSEPANYYGPNLRYKVGGTGSARVRWQATLGLSGRWEVFAWWCENANRGSNVPYIISNVGGPTTVRVNQQLP